MILEIAQIYEGEAGERHAPSHRQQPLLQATLSSNNTANDATQRKANNAHGAINQTYLTSGKTQTTLVDRVEQEGVNQFHQLSLRQTIQQHEDDSHQSLLLAEERLEGREELGHEVRCRNVFRSVVALRTRQDDAVIDSTHQEED